PHHGIFFGKDARFGQQSCSVMGRRALASPGPVPSQSGSISGGTKIMAEEQGSAQLLERLRSEQRECWDRGEHVLAEMYLQQHATLRDSADSALELVYNEVLLREKCGETPHLEEYVQRFPQLAPGLKRLFEVHQVLESGPSLTGSTLEATSNGTMPIISAADLPDIAGYEIRR